MTEHTQPDPDQQATPQQDAPAAAPAPDKVPPAPTPEKPVDGPSASSDKPDDYQESDVFAWANNLFEYKDDLTLEVFWINKNNVVYRTKLDPGLGKQLQPLFLDNTLEQVLDGAENGLVVHDYSDGEAQEGVLQRVRWKKVDKLREVMHWIRTQEEEIELFSDEEHDLRRIKGAVVRATHPKMPKPFYVFKALSGGQMLKGEGTWMIQGKTFKPFQTAALKIPIEAHMLVLDDDLYVFNQSKLDRLFGFDAQKNSIAAKKVAAIEAQYKLSFAEGLTLEAAVQGSKALVNKLQNVEVGALTQDQLIDHADELGIELLVDDAGAIIIMNQRDLSKFVGLLNDDFVESNLTGNRYEMIRKRVLKPAEEAPGG